MKILPRFKIMSFVVVNMYTNIPISETVNILRENQHISKHTY